MRIEKDFLPLGIAFLLIIISIIAVFVNYIVGTSFYLGIIVVGLSTVLYFTNKSIYRYFFSFVLVLAVFNLIDFFFINFTLIIFNVIALLVLAVFLFVNKDTIENRLRRTFSDDEEVKVVKSQSKYSGFKKRFSRLSDDEIEEQLCLNLVPEAIKALEEIKEQRNNQA